MHSFEKAPFKKVLMPGKIMFNTNTYAFSFLLLVLGTACAEEGLSVTLADHRLYKFYRYRAKQLRYQLALAWSQNIGAQVGAVRAGLICRLAPVVGETLTPSMYQ